MAKFGTRILLLASAIYAAITLIGSLGDASDVWTKIHEWLTHTTGLKLPIIISFAIGMVALAALLTILERLLRPPEESKGSSASGFRSPAHSDREVRQSYLELMQREVDNRLQVSIHHAVLLDLHLEERPRAAVPWHFVADLGDNKKKTFQNFEEALCCYSKRVLLLGAPGSGKTTTLLHVAQQLIQAALDNENMPIPLMENLSKFQDVERHFPLLRLGLGRRREQDDYDSEDRALQHRLASLIARRRVRGLTEAVVNQWIEQGRVFLLLDGLDEIEDHYLPRLARRLNRTLLAQYPDMPTVVASRIIEYQPLESDKETRLKLDGAVTVQMLSDEQIETYLTAAGAQNLREALPQDEILYELSRNPLTLSMMVFAYRGLHAEEIRSDLPLVERRRELFDQYITRMMEREAYHRHGLPWNPGAAGDITPRYPREQVNRYLGWLAVRLSERMQTRFPMGRIAEFLRERLGLQRRKFWSPIIICTALSALILSALLIGGLSLVDRSFLTPPAPPILLMVIVPVVYLLTRLAEWYNEQAPSRILLYGLRWLLVITGLSAYSILTSHLSIVLNGVITPASIAILLTCISLTTALYFGKGAKELPYRRWLSLPSIAGALLCGGGAMLFGGSDYVGGLAAAGALISTVTFITRFLFVLGEEAPEDIEAWWALILWVLCIVLGMIPALLTWGINALLPIQNTFAAAVTCAVAMGFLMAWVETQGTMIPLVVGAVAGGVLKPPAGVVAGALAGALFSLILRKQFVALTDRVFINQIALLIFKLGQRIPWGFRQFLEYSEDALLLRRVGNEYEFMHMLLRNHFAIRELTPRLHTGRLQSRLTTIRRLSRQGEAALEALRPWLDAPNLKIQEEAVRTVGRIPSPEVEALMIKVMKTGQSQSVRLAALECIDRLPDADQLIQTALEDAAPELRLRIAEQITSGPSQFRNRYTKHLEALLNDPSPHVVRRVLAAYGAGTTRLSSATPKDPDSFFERLQPFLSDESEAVRLGAVRVLGLAKLHQGVAALSDRLDQETKKVKAAIAWSLGNIGNPAAIPALLRVSHASARRIREQALLSLQPILKQDAAKAYGDQVKERLILALSDRARLVRCAAAGALGAFTTPDVILALRRALDDRSEFVRVTVVGAMGRIGAAEFTADLLKALKRHRTREKAAFALSHIGGSALTTLLISAVEAPWSLLQLGAVMALGHMAEPQAARAIASLLARIQTPFGYLLETLLRILAAIGLPVGPREAACVEALGQIGDPEALPQLIKSVQRKDAQIRTHAAMALGKIGGAEARDALIQALDDEDRQVVEKAIHGLSRIGDLDAADALLNIEKRRRQEGEISRKALDAVEEILLRAREERENQRV